MANKFPGVYVNTYNNSYYSNTTVSSSATSVALIGFAKKGTIGVPTEITSYRSFVKKFGTPIEGQYSTAMISKIISAGGKVLFTRIADNTATTSKVIIKGGSEAYNGYTYFNNTSDVKVGESGYYTGKIYTFNVEDNDGDSKDIFVRSPISGRLSRSSIYSQIAEQISSDTAGSYEIVSSDSSVSGFYAFNIETTSDAGKTYSAISTEPFYVTLSTSESAELIVDSLNAALSCGSNSYEKVFVFGGSDLTYSTRNTVDYTITSTSNSKVEADKSYTFRISVNGGSSILRTVSFSADASDGTSVTFGAIAEKLTSNLASYNVKVYFVDADSSTATPAYFAFVNTKAGSNYSVTIASSNTNNIASANDLFLCLDETVASGFNGIVYTDGTNISPFDTGDSTGVLESDEYDAFTGIMVQGITKMANGSDAASDATFTIEYNSSTNSIVLENSDTSTGVGIRFTPTAAPYGDNFVEDSNVGTVLEQRFGQAGIAASCTYEDGTIKLVAEDSLEPPEVTESTFATNDSTGYYLNLLDIMDDVTEVTGSSAVLDAYKDIIVVESLEKGEETAGIQLVVGTTTTTSTTGDETSVRYFEVYNTSGTLVETFTEGTDFTSMVYGEEGNFIDVINDEDEGSDYISISVIKNEIGDDVKEVQIEDGTYELGTGYTLDNGVEHSTERTSSIDEDAYTSYDYEIGSNGETSETDALYEELMSTEEDDEGVLADYENYPFDILVTPDNINQEVQDTCITLCEYLGTSEYIADPPDGLSAETAIKWTNGQGYGRTSKLNSEAAAVYYPWVKSSVPSYDSDGNATTKKTWVMPSVEIAPLWVSTVENYGFAYAPAGEVRGILGATNVRTKISRTQRSTMYLDPNRINPILINNSGNVLAYGEKTTTRLNSSLTKIHAKLTTNKVASVIRKNLKQFVFLPTFDSNIEDIKDTVTTILDIYKDSGALSSYTVVCDSTNNTSETLEQGIVYVDIGIVPIGCIEEIEVNINVNKSSESVSVSS